MQVWYPAQAPRSATKLVTPESEGSKEDGNGRRALRPAMRGAIASMAHLDCGSFQALTLSSLGARSYKDHASVRTLYIQALQFYHWSTLISCRLH